MNWLLRLAEPADVPVLRDLITLSAGVLLRDVYSHDQIMNALGPVFGVDEQMIADGTYFVVESGQAIAGCGGWSFREALFGGRVPGGGEPRRLQPGRDAARIRAFFVHPSFARRGIGRAIMKACEEAVRAHGFTWGEISATLAGEPLYQQFGYRTECYYDIPLVSGLPLRVARMTKDYRVADTQMR